MLGQLKESLWDSLVKGPGALGVAIEVAVVSSTLAWVVIEILESSIA